jgi:hypothetical protein
MFIDYIDLLDFRGARGVVPPEATELLAYSLPNRERYPGTGSARAMLLAGRLIGVIAGSYPVTAVSSNSKVPATVTSAPRVAGG